ncbi:MAG TPA: COR domain-containing protein [Phycisphaerae bacterium]|nr:COR domain-containing protein [Phycisphaerae bacterium]
MELVELEALERLWLQGNQLAEVPKELGELKELKELRLHNNQLTTVPKELGQLKSLTELRLHNNQLTSVPKELGELKALKELFLQNNELAAVPKELGELKALTELRLQNNQLIAVPKELGGLKSLTQLFLQNNELTAVPKELGELKALTELFLNTNKLTEVPKELGELKALSRLFLFGNQLTEVPKELGKLRALKELWLQNNQLAQVPKELGESKALTALFLHGNRALGLPPEVLGPTWDECIPYNRHGKSPAKPAEILAYYSRLQQVDQADNDRADTARRLNECKLLLVGQGGVGKTSLVNRLIRDQFSETEEKTEGIGREPWSMASPHHSEQITLNIWDFGGQEIMHATHQFFLTKRSIYLVVLDARKGENEGNIHYWLGIIRAFGDDSPVIVVTNKCDPPNDLNLNETRLRLDYPNIKSFVKTSCLTQRGIQELQVLIQKHVWEMEHVFNKLPPGWAEVKQELADAAAKRNYVDQEDYCAIADRHGIKEPLQRSLLLRLLHDLGTVLNYNDEDDRFHLNDTHILDPQWVTRGVYRLLNENELFQSHGVLRLCDVKKYLRDADGYHTTGRDFIIGMMKKFQLCFDHPINGEPGVLIPELLLKDEPNLPWGAAGTLAFEYHYDVLPAGVIPRFIVLSHSKHARGGACWRSGVVLEDEGCRVLVRGDTKAGKVFIHVQPTSSKAVGNRRLALKTVRNCFDQIHQNLVARAMVPLTDDPKAEPIKYEYLCQLEREEGSGYSWKPDGASRKYTVRELLDGIETPEEQVERRQQRELFGSTKMSEPRHKPRKSIAPPASPAKPSFVTLSIVAVVAIVILLAALTVAWRYIGSVWAFGLVATVAVLMVVLAFSFIAVISGEIKGTAFERIAIAVLEKLPLIRNFLPKQEQFPKK